MNTQDAIIRISEVSVKKVVVRLSLSGVGIGVPLIQCLWPKVTFEFMGKDREFAFTEWRTRGLSKPPHVAKKQHNVTDLVFLTAGLRPCERPMVLLDAAEAKGKMLDKAIQNKIAAATQKKSIVFRYKRLQRKLERAEGKKKIRELLLTLPLRLEKRDVIEAWQEAIVHKIMDS